MELLLIYACLGAAYWVLALAAFGESEALRRMPRRLRFKIHAIAFVLSLVLWPVAVWKNGVG